VRLQRTRLKRSQGSILGGGAVPAEPAGGSTHQPEIYDDA
jgi:hypothetical protein